MKNSMERYIQIVQYMNESENDNDHLRWQVYHQGFVEGLRILGADIGAYIMAADNYYLSQGITRPMCGGEFLDWKPKEAAMNGQA